MSTPLYVIIGVVSLVVIIVIIQYIRKSVYSKAVYKEVEKLPEGQQLMAAIRSQPEEVRTNLAMIQLKVLKISYKESIAPSVAAQAMIGAVNEMLNEWDT